MPAVRFTIQVLGETLHGVAFQTETELDALLACRHVTPAPAAVRTSTPALEESRQRGRPCFNDMIAGALDAVGPLDRRLSCAARARLVLRHLARAGTAADLMPSMRTVEIHVANLVRGKSRGKLRNKSGGEKIARNRRKKC